LALIRAESTDPAQPLAFLQAVRELLPDEQETALQQWGPVPAPMEKRAGRFRAHLLLQASRRAPLHAALSALIPRIEALPGARRVRWSVDVDPQDMG
jgi:primosomal protein N' (replication factor Y)